MSIIVFSNKIYDQTHFEVANRDYDFKIKYVEAKLTAETAKLAQGYSVVCVFVNDICDEEVITLLAHHGVKIIALRCAGFNNVDLDSAVKNNICVVRVPEYSPYAVAEHAIALMMSLNRKTHRAHNRVREGNFSLQGLIGFDMHGKTAGIIGTGIIGEIAAKILKNGFGCQVLAYDIHQKPELTKLGVEYVSLQELLQGSDIISLHCPLNPQTQHIINENAISSMKDGCMLINTSRGGLIDTAAVIEGLKSRKIGYLGIDVYEEEADMFFEDLSSEFIEDDVFARLLTFPNVLITGHQAYFTEEALYNISKTTLENIKEINEAGKCQNAVSCCMVKKH